MSGISLAVVLGFGAAIALPAGAADPDRDFSGKWVLDSASSEPGSLSGAPEQSLVITQQGNTLRCGPWLYTLDGSDSISQAGRETRNTVTKWEGVALLLNILVSGPQNYTLAERWRLSRDHSTLTVRRQVTRGVSTTEGTLVYRREGWKEVPPAAAKPQAAPPAEEPAPLITVPAGTRVLLELVNSVDTRHSHAGDRIYLQTAMPVFLKGRTVIPRGSQVSGTVTSSKRPGRVAGKGELFVRFDSLTLPNGVTRELRSRMGGADGDINLDRQEGKITSPGGKANDGRTVARGTQVGAAAGGIAGAAAGSTGKGVGIGAAAGAAAGLTSVLLKRGPDAILPKGATVEMLLDRDLQFTARELP